MSEHIQIWALRDEKDLERLPKVDGLDKEDTLEDLLVTHPEVLEPGVTLVGRQTPTAGGPLDLLGVDTDGRLVVFELKRGTLRRDAVTQAIDYASALDGLSIDELTLHIQERSGASGITRIDDFRSWYTEKTQPWGDEQSDEEAAVNDLLPPRLVLVGLGADEATERMVRFVRSDSVDITLITLQVFEHGGSTLLARRVEIDPEAAPNSERRPPSVADRRRTFERHLTKSGLRPLFEAVHTDLRQWLSSSRFSCQQTKRGLSFRLSTSTGWQTAFGVFAAYSAPDAVDVSIGRWALDPGEAALGRLENVVELFDWHGSGKAFSIKSEGAWKAKREAMHALVSEVLQNR